MRKGFNLRDLDWLLLLTALILAAIGIVEIYSTTMHTALAGQYKKQIDWVLVGAVLALVASQIDYRIIFDQSILLYVVSVLGLGALLVIGHPVGGVRRWISIGGFSFQVSEMVKLIIIVCVAAYFASRKAKPVTWKDLAFLGLLVGIPAVLVAREPDLGTALTFAPAVIAGIFLAGIRFRQLLIIAVAIALMLPVGWHVLRPYQRERLMTFVHPAQDVRGSSYQVTQSKIAIGSGGLWGKGVGNGTQSRLGFIPVSHADFIFAAYAEEQGFAGTLVVLFLYFVLLIRLLDGAQMAGDRAGAFFVIGLASVLFFQVAVNVGMMIGFLPITGIPLPLMSQGGSSVLFTFVGLGLAMSVRMRRLVN
ncbi:MAG TPA: rod shape-determining protein RodA [Terriglobia bacterium]|nr:rod shape-determining protein RodA [Terriglobia bacterium]